MKKRSIWSICLVLFLLIQTMIGMSTQVKADNSDFGVDAYNYMNFIQTNYPNRVVGTPNEKAMEAWLIQEATAMGYAPYTFFTEWDQDGIHYEGDAILFEKPGNTGRRIVVGAHYDSVETNGADDNASGVALLLETAKRMIDVPTQYTIQFALFSIEEPGCMGSQYYVSRETQEYRDSVAVMINLDTIAAGDNMYVYGGGIDENGNLVRTWGAYQALATAQDLGLNITFHPDVNERYPVPIKDTASDHMAYEFHHIPYIYFEASNWNGGNFTNFFQTADSRVPDGKMMHTWMDNLSFYNETFPGRVQNHLRSYSILLNTLLRGLVEDSTESIVPKPQYVEVNESVYAVSDVNIRSGAGTSFDSLGILKTGKEVVRTGYNEEWSRVEYNGTTAYIASRYLSTEMPETTAAESESVTEETTAEEPVTEKITVEENTAEETEADANANETSAETTELSSDNTPSETAETVKNPSEAGSEGGNIWPWIAGAAVLCIGTAGAAAWIIRSRRRPK